MKRFYYKKLLVITSSLTICCLTACNNKNVNVNETESSSIKAESTACFSEDELATFPVYYLIGGRISQEEREKEYYGDNYELYLEYITANEVTEDLYNRMKEAGLTGIQYDIDGDGLSDEEEIEVYHTDPNKISTSGDLYSDYYKVQNQLDVNKQYEQKWVDVDENLMVFPEVIIDDKLNYPGITENYYDLQGVTQFDVGWYFAGDVKLKVNIDGVVLEDLVVEVYNVVDGTHEIIDSSVEGDRICFHVYKGYDKYLIHSKEVEVVIDSNTAVCN